MKHELPHVRDLLLASDEPSGRCRKHEALLESRRSPLRLERLAEQRREVIEHEPFQLIGGVESVVRDVAGGVDAIEQFIQSLLARSALGRLTYTSLGLPSDRRYSSSNPDTDMPGATHPYRCQ